MTAMNRTAPHHPSDQTRVWDLPIRLFHPLLALCVTGALITVKLGGNWMTWHVRLGIITLALLLFRLIWGICGSRYARFTQFVKSPAATLSYLKTSGNEKKRTAGHNPLGAWSVLAMLLLLGLQALTGLFTSDEIVTEGPFFNLVSDTSAKLLTNIHHLNETPIYLILGLHLLAILVYSLKGHRLVTPMISGDVPTEQLVDGTQSADDSLRLRLLALAIASLLALGAYYLMMRT